LLNDPRDAALVLKNFNALIRPRFNPHHEPGGSPEGGQFSSGDGDGGGGASSGEHAGVGRSWEGFPFRKETGEAPEEKDTPPERTKSGDFILYHGTSGKRADQILKDNHLKPDNLGVVGVATIPGQAQVFAVMSSQKDKEPPGSGVVFRIVVDHKWLAKQSATREIGGSGHDQFLIRPPAGVSAKDWKGIPSEALKNVAEVSITDDGKWTTSPSSDDESSKNKPK
jgi:hypothetical protein